MMEKVMYFCLVLGIMVLIYGCGSKEEPTPTSTGGDPISYSSTIKPIISANCAISGCHVPGVAGRSDLSNDATIKSQAGNIKSLTSSKVMPKTGSLTDVQIAQIGQWVDEGASISN